MEQVVNCSSVWQYTYAHAYSVAGASIRSMTRSSIWGTDG